MELDELEMIKHIRERQKSMSLRSFATLLGVSAAYLSDIYLGKRAIGKKVCDALGYRRRKTTVTTLRFTKAK